ncbi:MAG: 2-succinyl-5-enolpyruvyl-6-hydroxy-3-cyclohexene-1-carboxylic-acid synthase [Solirubrobacterales bacterium]
MDATNRNTALCSVLVDELARAGVEHAVVAPGSRSAPLALAFWNEPRIKVWSIIDERSAGFFALGIAQQTGLPAAVVTTSGTAAANVHPAVAEADEARVPLLVVTADRPPELRGRGAGQTIDQLKLYGSSVRWFCELGTIDADDDGLLYFRSAGSRAVAEALGSPPGPVHLNVPLRDPLAPTRSEGDVSATSELAREGRDEARPLTAVPRAPTSPWSGLIDALDVALARRRGVVLAGRQAGTGPAPGVLAFAAAARWPVLCEPTSPVRAAVADTGNLVAAYDAIFRSLPRDLEPEIVVRVGDMVTSKGVRTWLASHPECDQIVIDPDGAWNEPTTRAAAIVRADAGGLLDAIAARIAPAPDGWLESWQTMDATANQAIDDFLLSHTDELFEPGVHRMLADLLPDPATVYVASSMPVRNLESFLPSSPKQIRFLANRGANGIDGTVSAGLGAAAASDAPAFVLLGDVALYHDMNGLLAMKRNGVAATIVVMNNGGGAIFDFLPIAAALAGERNTYEELFGTATGLDMSKVADLYEVPFTRVASYEDLGGALASPGIIEVPLNRARNVELHRELFESVGEALAR